MDALLEHLTQLLHGDTASVFDGPVVPVSIDYGNRELSAEDARRLLGLFMRVENFLIREWGAHTAARRALLNTRGAMTGQTIHKGTVRSGQRVVSDGDLVVIGDVNPGGEVAAVGDVYIFGRLAGIAHAGIDGDERAIIAAAELRPLQLRIARTVSRPPEGEGWPPRTFMEFAYLGPDGMAVERLQYLSALRPR